MSRRPGSLECLAAAALQAGDCGEKKRKRKKERESDMCLIQMASLLSPRNDKR